MAGPSMRILDWIDGYYVSQVYGVPANLSGSGSVALGLWVVVVVEDFSFEAVAAARAVMRVKRSVSMVASLEERVWTWLNSSVILAL